MTQPAPRAVRLHLATLIAVALGAVALGWLNLTPRIGGEIGEIVLAPAPGGRQLATDAQYFHDYRYLGYGWPSNQAYVEKLPNPEKDWDPDRPMLYSFQREGWRAQPLLFDLAAAVVLLGLLAGVFEIASRIQLQLWPLGKGCNLKAEG
ncbi:MAG: hypothetical protein M5U26_16820 [Planctomycetota bacterium]|nr:hypothetical protein [Planctomycetota bacterium]